MARSSLPFLFQNHFALIFLLELVADQAIGQIVKIIGKIIRNLLV